MNNIDSKPVCMVTGGSAGIGLAVCEKFLAKGYRVINLDIAHNKAANNKIHWLECDISKPAQVEAVILKLLKQYKRIDALISNAGVHFSANIEETLEQDLDRIIAINIKGAYAAIRGGAAHHESTTFRGHNPDGF